MSVVALLDETTERVVLALPGTIGLSWLMDGAVTSYVTSDRQPLTDGVIGRPDLVSLTGILTGGGAAIDQALGTLRALKEQGAPVTIQRPGRAPIASMQIERIGTEENRTDGAPFSIDFKQRRTARSREVTLATTTPPNATRGPPRADIAPGQAETVQTAERPTSLLASGWDALGGVLR